MRADCVLTRPRRAGREARLGAPSGGPWAPPGGGRWLSRPPGGRRGAAPGPVLPGGSPAGAITSSRETSLSLGEASCVLAHPAQPFLPLIQCRNLSQ